MALRSTILYLSRHKALRNFIETSRVAGRVSRRFVAGSRLEDALDVCRRIRAEGITATLDYLGENVKSLDGSGGLPRYVSADAARDEGGGSGTQCID